MHVSFRQHARKISRYIKFLKIFRRELLISQRNLKTKIPSKSARFHVTRKSQRVPTIGPVPSCQEYWYSIRGVISRSRHRLSTLVSGGVISAMARPSFAAVTLFCRFSLSDSSRTTGAPSVNPRRDCGPWALSLNHLFLNRHLSSLSYVTDKIIRQGLRDPDISPRHSGSHAYPSGGGIP